MAGKRTGFCVYCAAKSKAKSVHLVPLPFPLPCRQCGNDTMWVEQKKQ